MAFEIPEIGEDNSTAAPKVNACLLDLDTRAKAAAGIVTDRKISCGVGDSLAGHYRRQWAQSPYHEMFAKHYNANVFIDPAWTFSAPGQRSDYVLANMVPALAAQIASTGIKPDWCDLTSGQNDGVVRLDIAQGTFTRVTETARQIKAMGIKDIIVWGPVPDPKLNGNGRPQALDWLNTALMNWCAVTPGMHFLNLLGLVRDRTLQFDLSPTYEVRWKGGVAADGSYMKAGGIGGAGIDNEHPAPYFAVLVAPELAKIVRRFCGEMPMPDTLSINYDAAYNPLGNYLGGRGAFLGTGGTYNGTENSANVAANWTITHAAPGGNAVITPYVFVDARGNRRQGFTHTGTPTASGIITCTTTLSTAAPGGKWLLHGRMRRRNWKGMAGKSLSGPQIDVGGAGALYHIEPDVIDDDILIRAFYPQNFGNAFSSQTFTSSTAFQAGVEMSGATEWYSTGLTPVSLN